MIKTDLHAVRHPPGSSQCDASAVIREDRGGEPYEYVPLGRHIVSARGVCGGEPTFKYTRINVRFIVDRVRAGESPQEILAAYGGRITPEALEEALRVDLTRIGVAGFEADSAA